VSSTPEVAWFRPPAEDAGTLNACYNALDIHVIRGRAEEVALADPPRDWTFARLLTEVAACAGVLRAFGVGVGDRVAIGFVPVPTAVIVVLAVARVGAVAVYDNSAAPEAKVQVGGADGAVTFGVDDEQVPWDVAMRAGRTDPAPCADVPGDALLLRHRDDTLSVLEALGATDGPMPTTAGASAVEVGGVTLWVFESE
jgi:acyl-CoA synthetase (AMP-forming)/AMP-acid ligase II